MNFSDILNLFNQGKSTAKSHMKNLIEMAASDGNFDEVEFDLLKKIAKRNNISESQLKAIRNDTSSITFEIPEDKIEKFNQLYDLVHMMIVDEAVHQEEMKLCNLFAIKFGYNKDKVDELIGTIQNNIKNGNNHIEAMKRVNILLG